MKSLRKVWTLLEPAQRAGAVWLMVLMTIGMLLEMLGIGLVLPALSLLSGVQGDGGSRWAEPLAKWLGNPSGPQLLVGGLLAVVAIYLVKTAFLAYLAFYQASFVANLQANVSRRLFTLYLHQPWTFHLQRNSATLIRNVSTEVTQFANVATALATFGTEVLVLTGVSGLLLAIEPVGAVGVAALLGASTWLLQLVLHNRLSAWGVNRRHHERLRLQHVHQGLAGAKDAKLLGREGSFVSEFEKHNQASARIAGRVNAVSQIPRLWYELIAVGGLTALAAILVWQGNTGNALVARLGLFAVAAFRLLPSAIRMLNTWQTLRYAGPVVASLYEELQGVPREPPPAHRERLPFRDAISLEDVWLQYAGAPAPALRGVSLRIRQGLSFGIIGGSGAGKSTLVDVILGLLVPDRGAVRIDGKEIHSCLREWQNIIGYVPQSIYLTDDTIRRNVAFGIPASDIDDTAVRRALVAAQLDTFVNTLPQGIDTVVGERGVRLSGGQRQRIGIARALYLDPDVLVLDEATSSLDTDTERGVMEAVNQLHGRKTLIIVAHRLSTVANCDELIKLEHGAVVSSGRFDDVTDAPAAESRP